MNNLCIIPGAYNPLHVGHLIMAQYMEAKMQSRVILEISTDNLDKGQISEAEKVKRARGIHPYGREYVYSQYPTFFSKVVYDYSIQFPHYLTKRISDRRGKFYFGIGADTAIRIVNARCTNHNKDELNRSLNLMIAYGVQFVVFPRSNITAPEVGKVYKEQPCECTPAQFFPSVNLDELFIWADIKMPDISSTSLREKAEKK